MNTAPKPPFAAYKGSEPYVFVSYAHRDADLVFPELTRLRELGLHVWYDEGIDPGNEWPDEVASAVRDSSYFIFFVSPQSVASVNCRNEIYFALEHKIHFLSIYLEETHVAEINGGLQLSIGSLQAILRYQMDDEGYKYKLAKTLGKYLPVSKHYQKPAAELASSKLESPKKPGRPLLYGVSSLILLAGLILGGYFLLKSRANLVTKVPPLQVNPTPAPTPTPTLAQVIPPSPSPAPPTPVPTVSAPIVRTNSLNMKFVPAGTPGILFCTCPTRLKDFHAFIDATHHVTALRSTFRLVNGEKESGGSWLDPGFEQRPDHPVVGINWDDAEAFCKWLTDKERMAGTISNTEKYRLPTYAEWKTAQGTSTYPWGNEWPPPLDAGNLGRQGDGWTLSPLSGTDGYQFTSPVGSFKPNAFGLYDMAGNVYEWGEDFYRAEGDSAEMTRSFRYTEADKGKDFRQELGTGFHIWGELVLHSGFHRPLRFPRDGSCYRGFRCVLVVQ